MLLLVWRVLVMLVQLQQQQQLLPLPPLLVPSAGRCW